MSFLPSAGITAEVCGAAGGGGLQLGQQEAASRGNNARDSNLFIFSPRAFSAAAARHTPRVATAFIWPAAKQTAPAESSPALTPRNASRLMRGMEEEHHEYIDDAAE